MSFGFWVNDYIFGMVADDRLCSLIPAGHSFCDLMLTVGGIFYNLYLLVMEGF